MENLLPYLQSFLSSLGPFFLLLGLLIFVHELGHYLVAVYFGVRVETFSLGFGKKIFSYKRGHTTYCISIIPLGGYVKMFGDDPTNPPPEHERHQSFLHQPVWPRIAIVLAGPIMNLIFAILLFAHIGYWGEPVPGTKLGDIPEASLAYDSGFRSGDKITSIDDKPVTTWKQVREVIETSSDKNINFLVERESGGTQKIQTTPITKPNPNIFSTNRQVGVIEGLQLDSKATLVAVFDEKLTQGIKNLDLITEINGKKIEYWRHLESELTLALTAGAPVKVIVESTLDKKPQPRQLLIDPKLVANFKEPLKSLGLESPDLNVYSVKRNSPAAQSGLLPGDRILKIGSKQISKWEDLLETVKSYSPDSGPLEFNIRRNGQMMSLNITPEITEIPNMKGNFDRRFAIGISPALYSVPNENVIFKADGLVASFKHGFVASYEWSKLICVSFVRLIQAEVSAKNIGGVISIGRVASQSYDMGWLPFIKMMAIISINLFILNLLPVPVLDGGHLVFFTIEAIKGSPLSLKKMEYAQQLGMVLLLCLMVFALFNDITQLITAW